MNTLGVSTTDKNFFLSPITMALLINGSSALILSSMGTGAMFSPPAVIINSKTENVELHFQKSNHDDAYIF